MLALLLAAVGGAAGFALPWPGPNPRFRRPAAARVSASGELDDHISIDLGYPGIKRLYSSPDIFVVANLLTPAECAAVVASAEAQGLDESPVTYAGWSSDAVEIGKLAASGPAVWVALLRMWLQGTAGGASTLDLGVTGVTTWLAAAVLGYSAALTFVKLKERDLSKFRSSTSTALSGGGVGDSALVEKCQTLLKSRWSTFERPTVIKYAPGQALVPHYDANRDAATEDESRGGQTLATVLCYLNDVEEGTGGRTRFGGIDLNYTPVRGSAVVFFPANAAGEFDERLEHEGEPGEAEKWLVRIWRHKNDVSEPCGMGAWSPREAAGPKGFAM